jgi:O-antigen ligase
MTKLLLSTFQFPWRFPTRRDDRPLKAVTPFWLGLWACTLAFAWLLPNHYMPWTAFHTDSWAALVLALGSAGIILRSPAPAVWHWTSLLAAALVGIPIIQYAFGILPFAGQAWISTTYLLGFLLALLTGTRWESADSGQLIDGLFFAIGTASVLSVGLQLHQWFDLQVLDFSSMGSSGGRPYANLGQPNQLGTLLLWGLLACAWGVLSQKIRAPFAILMASYLLFGIALTQSRTAWVGLLLLLGAAWMWRRWWPSKWMPWIVTALAVYFLACNLALSYVTDALHLAAARDLQDGMQAGLRPAAWHLFIDAALQRPWFGYGWTGVGQAQLAVALDHPGLGIGFAQSHNLFLDLVLWCGLPIGLIVSGSLVYWFASSIRAIANIRDAVLLMFVAIIGNHAMLELPLHYAYFLLPTGVVVGVLSARIGGQPVIRTPRWALAGIWMLAAILLSVSIRDYFKVEENFYALRFERARIGTLPPLSPPDVVLLTQFREGLRYARFEPRPGLSDANLQWMRNVVKANPGPGEMYKLATALALNQRPDEAQLVLSKMCKIVPNEKCAIAGRAWAEQSLKEPQIAATPWPH